MGETIPKDATPPEPPEPIENPDTPPAMPWEQKIGQSIETARGMKCVVTTFKLYEPVISLEWTREKRIEPQMNQWQQMKEDVEGKLALAETEEPNPIMTKINEAKGEP